MKRARRVIKLQINIDATVDKFCADLKIFSCKADGMSFKYFIVLFVLYQFRYYTE